MQTSATTEFKVAQQSNPRDIAGALARRIFDRGAVPITAIGPGAVNQTVKAIAIAMGYLAPKGILLESTVRLEERLIRGENRTIVVFTVRPSNRMVPVEAETVRISARTLPKSLSGYLAATLRKRGALVCEAMGATAVNQAVKGIATAMGFLGGESIPISLILTFKQQMDGDEMRTAIRLCLTR